MASTDLPARAARSAITRPNADSDASEGPLIAIVGSVDDAREYRPAIVDPATARHASAELGAELAHHGCRIIVYSSAPGFIEGDVVRGYIGSGRAAARSIRVRFPIDTGAKFAIDGEQRPVFDLRPDSSPDWEVSFYRSLAEADGVVLLGGGRSTYVAGLIALSHGIPLLAVATFGGNARQAWEVLDRDKGLASDEEIAAMAREWDSDSAATLVDGLLAALQRRVDADCERDRRATSYQRRVMLSSMIAGLLLAAAIAAIPLSWNWRAGTSAPLAVLLLAPLLAGAAGSIVRVVFDAGRDWTKTAVLGLAAGALAALLFVAAQIAATPDILDGPGARRLLFFVIPAAFIAGFTFDIVYQKLKASDVVQTSVVEGPGAGPGSRR
jgi:hypothetical protein